jgi:hypothetical protein
MARDAARNTRGRVINALQLAEVGFESLQDEDQFYDWLNRGFQNPTFFTQLQTSR